MTALAKLLDTLRQTSLSEPEKGTYFEELIVCYLTTEPKYVDLYNKVWPYKIWAKEQNLPDNDTGVDLVARERGTHDLHAIQCKFYGLEKKVSKADIDTFFAASGKKWFSHRVIISTTDNWTQNAEETLEDQHPPVTRIGLHDLQQSVIDWSQYHPKREPVTRTKKTPFDHQNNAIKSVLKGFEAHNRGRLIMACGTG